MEAYGIVESNLPTNMNLNALKMCLRYKYVPKWDSEAAA